MTKSIDDVSDLTPWGTATRYRDLEPDIGVTPDDIRSAVTSRMDLHLAVTALGLDA